MATDEKLMIWSWRHAVISSSLRPTPRHVLLTTACFMNEVGGGCYPTTKQLAGASGLSERCVCTHLDIAEADGWLKVTPHGLKGQKWKNNQYQAAWPEGTEAGSVPSKAKALNVVPKGTERRSKKALKDVQSNSPSYPSIKQKKRACAREDLVGKKKEPPKPDRPTAFEKAVAEGAIDMAAVKAATQALRGELDLAHVLPRMPRDGTRR